MYQTLKMVMSDLHLNCASTGSKHVKPMNILISYITFSSFTQWRTAPINPALNDSAHKALINLVHEMEDAKQATKELAEWLNNTRPGKHGELPMQAIKQIYDLTQANKTLMYSMAREFDLKITDLTEKWSKKPLSQRWQCTKGRIERRF